MKNDKYRIIASETEEFQKIKDLVNQLPLDVQPEQRLIAEMQASGVVDIRPEIRDISKVSFKGYGESSNEPNTPIQFCLFDVNSNTLGLQYEGTSFRLYLKK